MIAVQEITEAKHIRILMDEKRQDVLRALREGNRPMTVSQIADVLGVSPANVHFHVRKLVDIGVLHIVRTEEIRGIIAKYYEPTAMVFKIAAPDIDAATRRTIANSFAKDALHTFDEAKADFLTGCEQEQGSHKRLSYSTVYLTEDEFTEINHAVDEMLQRYMNRGQDGQQAYRLLVSCVRHAGEDAE